MLVKFDLNKNYDMKTMARSLLILACITGLTLSSYSEKGPVDPAGPGTGIIGFGFGPGTGFYGGGGFGPAILVHYDHSIWQAGPGVISLGGQIGTSFFRQKYTGYNYGWTNLGFVFRGAYHYGWKVPGLDTYAGLGAGTWVSIYDDAGYNPGKGSVGVGFLPTFFFGGSYYFNHLLGINAETGYNFAWFSVGLNFRLGK